MKKINALIFLLREFRFNIIKLINHLNENLDDKYCLFEGWGVDAIPPLEYGGNYIFVKSSWLHGSKEDAINSIHKDDIIMHVGYEKISMTPRKILNLKEVELANLKRKLTPNN